MRLIDADALFENLKENDYFKARTVATISAKAVIHFAPTIDAEPVRHGHWVICSDGYYPYCSKCKQEPSGKSMTNYCPNCGAKMDEVCE